MEMSSTWHAIVSPSHTTKKTDVFQENFEKLNNKCKKLMQNLADL